MLAIDPPETCSNTTGQYRSEKFEGIRFIKYLDKGYQLAFYNSSDCSESPLRTTSPCPFAQCCPFVFRVNGLPVGGFLGTTPPPPPPRSLKTHTVTHSPPPLPVSGVSLAVTAALVLVLGGVVWIVVVLLRMCGKQRRQSDALQMPQWSRHAHNM